MKLFSYTNKDKPINYFETNEQVVIPDKYQLKDVRSFWVSTVLNIDIPVFASEAQYKKELDEIIENALKYNINTIFFQVRPLNDAFYKSDLNPYSRFLMGKEGTKPPFDVLEYLIKKASKHNILIHAWCNPYRVSMKIENGTKKEYLESLDNLNFAKKHPELVITDENNQLIFNPAKEEVKNFIINSMVEIVKNYNVKGIHWDDYFYPYSPLSKDDNDVNDFNNRKNQEQSLGDFRRFHVTDVIKRTHEAIKNVDEKLEFGVSPFGIWQSKHNDARGSNTAAGTSESYKNQYADTYSWVKNEYIDYIVPQLYWEFGHKVAPFADLAKWWSEVVRGTNVKLYIGHASYRLGNEGEFKNPLEIANQLKYTNKYKEITGHVFFTYKNFKDIEVLKEGMEEIEKLFTSKQ